MVRGVITLMLVFCVVVQGITQVINIDDPSTYLPSEIKKIKIGMPLTDFISNTDTTTLKKDLSFEYLYTKYDETISGKTISLIACKFDTPENGKNAEMPLYEILITFNDSSTADKFVAEKFTGFYRTNDFAEKEWFLATNKDYRLLIRKNGPYLMIAASMSGTEWGYD